MEITDEVLDDLSARIMKLPGIDPTRNSFIILEEIEDDGDGFNVFGKFMSDGGVTDNKNGLALHILLEQHGVLHSYFDDRKLFVDVEGLEAFLQDHS